MHCLWRLCKFPDWIMLFFPTFASAWKFNRLTSSKCYLFGDILQSVVYFVGTVKQTYSLITAYIISIVFSEEFDNFCVTLCWITWNAAFSQLILIRLKNLSFGEVPSYFITSKLTPSNPILTILSFLTPAFLFLAFVTE